MRGVMMTIEFCKYGRILQSLAILLLAAGRAASNKMRRPKNDPFFACLSES